MTTNPGGPEIVPLTLWTENHITAIYKATNLADFDKAFDAFISKDAQITLNGRKLTREEYKLQLVGETFAEKSANVSFLGAVDVPEKVIGLTQTGTVGVFFQATVFGRLLFRGAPVTSTVNASLNATVAAGKSGTTVTVLNEVVVDHVNH